MEIPAMGAQLSSYLLYPTTAFGAELSIFTTELKFWKTLAAEDKTPDGYIRMYV
jgi:hypothetical protein